MDETTQYKFGNTCSNLRCQIEIYASDRIEDIEMLLQKKLEMGRYTVKRLTKGNQPGWIVFEIIKTTTVKDEAGVETENHLDIDKSEIRDAIEEGGDFKPYP